MNVFIKIVPGHVACYVDKKLKETGGESLISL